MFRPPVKRPRPPDRTHDDAPRNAMPTRPGLDLPKPASFRVYEDPDVESTLSRTGATVRNVTNFPTHLQQGSRTLAAFPRHGRGPMSPRSNNGRQPLANLDVNVATGRHVPQKITGSYRPSNRRPKDAFELPKLPSQLSVNDPNKENHFTSPNSKNHPPEDEVVEKIHANLVEILPNEDPRHLRFVASRHRNNEYELLKFVEKHMAPMKRVQKRADFRRDEEFNVVAFLRGIPDPFTHFLDPNRRCFFNAVCLKFLKNHFNRIKLDKICAEYTKAKHNMSIAAQSLAEMKENMKTTRPIFDLPTDDQEVRYEMSFIRHQAEIKDYMDCAKRLEEEKRLKEDYLAESTGEAVRPFGVVNFQQQNNQVIAEQQNKDKSTNKSNGRLPISSPGRNRKHVTFLHVALTERLSERTTRQNLNDAVLFSDSDDESLVEDDILDKLCTIFPTKRRTVLRRHCPSRWPRGVPREVFFGKIVLQVMEGDWEERGLNATFDSDVDVGAAGGRCSDCSVSPHKSNAVLRYSENFSVERFLQEIPDPFKFYQDEKRRTHYDTKVLQFLNHVFNRKRLIDIKQAYFLSNCNMSIAAQKLSSTTNALQQPRKAEINFDDVDVELLKEMTFVRHMDQIREHMDRKKYAL